MKLAIAVTTVSDDLQAAEKFASDLVKSGLAACASVSETIVSTYRWKGEIASDRERQITIKTTDENMAAIERFIKENHPYELPELIWFEPSGASADYLNWVQKSAKANI